MKRDFRHIVCVAITLGILSCVLLFPNSVGRVLEGCRDIGVSLAYYVCFLLQIEADLTPTVTQLPRYHFFSFLEDYRTPYTTLPESWSTFQASWTQYWALFLTKGNFIGYLSAIGNMLYRISWSLLLIVPLLIVIVYLFRRSLCHECHDDGKESKPLIRWKRFSAAVCVPVKHCISGFVAFLKAHSVYYKLWLFLFALYFNFLTIALEFLAFYLYFVCTFHFSDLYRQLYKLALDLFLPALGVDPVRVRRRGDFLQRTRIPRSSSSRTP